MHSKTALFCIFEASVNPASDAELKKVHDELRDLEEREKRKETEYGRE